MNWTPGPHAHYNAKFASHVIKAHVNGRKTFRFLKKSYSTAEFLPGVREDLKNGMYKIKVDY